MKNNMRPDAGRPAENNESPSGYPTLALSGGSGASRDVIDELVWDGARKMLTTALETEIGMHVARFADLRDEKGRRRVIRNGYASTRTILTGAGPIDVAAPRARDRAGEVKFTSAILPPYLRKSKKIDELIPWLYLKGISTGDMSEALVALLGDGAKGLSATQVVRMKEQWSSEYASWRRRDLSGKRYAYFWADGVHFNVRLEDERQCMLVVIGATIDGTKELLAVRDGVRESDQSWTELLLELRSHGLDVPPFLATGDGALGFWAALAKVFPTTRAQRCWVHKMANVLDKLPKALHARAKADLHEIWMAETRADAIRAFDLFVEKYGAKYPNAVGCLVKNRDEMLAFYDFPAEHWIHIRTTNPIESMFATVRHRHDRTKGSGTREACLAMVFKLAQSAERNWRRLNQPERIGALVEGRTFVDGIMQDAA